MNKIILLLSLIFSTLVFAETSTYEVLPVADTYVTSESEHRNFGSDSLLDLKTYYAGTRLLIRFDEKELRELIGEKEIVSARLELPIQNHYVKVQGEIGLFRMNVPWTEEGATWKCPHDTNTSNYQQDCSEPWLMWSHDPNNTIAYPYASSPLAVGIINAEQAVPVGFDVKTYVEGLVSQSNIQNYGFAVYKISTNINDPLAFYSRESDVGPKIILTLKEATVDPDEVKAKLTANILSGSAPLSVIFDASSSRASLGNSLTSFEINLGNGYIALNSITPTYSHTFNLEGEHQPILKVTDSSGKIAYTALNISVLGDEQNNFDVNYGYWINFPQNLNIKYKSGDIGQISGDICKIWKTQSRNSNCQWVDKQRIKIRAFFPDMTREVSSLFQVTTNNNRRNFSFTTPELNSKNLNVLTVLVGEIDPITVDFGVLKSKLEMRMLVLDQKIIDYENQGIDLEVLNVLRTVRKTLNDLISKIDSRNAKVPTTLAQYNLPLQVDNKISSGRYYSTMVGGFRYELMNEIGNLYQGDFAEIKSRITNINYSNNQTYDLEGYNFKYFYKGNAHSTQFKSQFLKGAVQEYVFQDSQGANLTDFYSFGVEVEEKFKWWSRSLGSTEFSMPVMEDTEAPYWVNPKLETLYATHLPIFSEKAIDNFGRLNRVSFKAILSGRVSADISDKFSFSSTSGGTDYTVRADLRSLYGEEGEYTLSYTISDFEGHKAEPEPYIRKFHIDRTAPFISLPIDYPKVTKVKELSIPFTVTDISEVKIKVSINGLPLFERTESGGIISEELSLDLVEGLNLIKIEAIDLVGNSSSINLEPIQLDSTPPGLLALSPSNGEVVYRTNKFLINGRADEKLSAAYINNSEVVLSGDQQSFEYEVSNYAEGLFQYQVRLIDLAGNESNFTNEVELVFTILNKNLITIFPYGEDDKLVVSGVAGSAKPGIEISAKGGFLNSATTYAEDDGSFEIVLDYFGKVDLIGYDNTSSEKEEFSLNFMADTTLSGIIKDNNNNPLPGVRITIQNSGQMATTDSTGTFRIENPMSGDQKIVINPDLVPIEVLGSERKLFSTVVNYSIGRTQLNVMPPIFLNPLILDGSQTIVQDSAESVVVSPHAPGFELVIPAGVAKFPNGQRSGEISVVEIPSNRLTIPTPDFATPDTVYALEPSGLKFDQPVKVTLPNPNNFAPGMNVLIMSKNSSTGMWEIDGVGEVSDAGDSISTKEGMGITHFSEIFAAPVLPTLSKIGPDSQPQASLIDDAVKAEITLPSYMSLNTAQTPSLIYRSNWANPVLLMKHLINFEQKVVTKTDSSHYKVDGFKVDETFHTRTWPELESIEFSFESNNLKSAPRTFTGIPNNSVLTFGFDLSEFESGIFPYFSHFDMKFKQLKIGTRNVYARKKYKSGWWSYSTYKTSWTEHYSYSTVFENLIPQDLSGPLYVSNKKSSPYGRGWKVNGLQEILNVDGPRIAIEEGNGDIKTFDIDQKLETVFQFSNGIEAASLSTFPSMTFLGQEGKIYNVLATTPTASATHISSLPAYNATYITWAPGTIVNGQPRNCYLIGGVMKVTPNGGNFLSLANGSLIGTDNMNGIVSVGDFSAPYVVGGKGRSPQSDDVWSFFDLYPNGVLNSVEGTSNCKENTVTGTLPKSGYVNGGFSTAEFNAPLDMIEMENNVVIVSDRGNNVLRKIDLNNLAVSTFAGNGTRIDSGNGGNGLSAGIYHPQGLARGDDGSIFISSENGLIRKIDRNGIITHVAGKNIENDGVFSDSTSIEKVNFNNPIGLAYDSLENSLYVADAGHNRIVKLNFEYGRAETVAGSGSCRNTDPLTTQALSANLCSPSFIHLDSDRNLLVLDKGNGRIRKLIINNAPNSPAQFASSSDGEILKKYSNGNWQRFYRNGVVADYNSLGKLIRIEKRDGNFVEYIYSNERLVKTIDQVGLETNYSYNGDGRLHLITDPAGRITTFSYSSMGDLEFVQYPDSSIKRFVYNEKGLLLETIDQEGSSTEYQYNEWNRLKKVVFADGGTVEYSNSEDSIILGNNEEDYPIDELRSYGSGVNDINLQVKDASNLVTSIVPGENGKPKEVIYSDGSVYRYEYDELGRITKTTLPDNNFTEIAYNSFGDVISIYESASNSTITRSYNEFGQILSETSSDGTVNSYEYDLGKGYLKSTKNSLNQISTYTYNDFGQILTVTNHAGHILRKNYDSKGNSVSAINEDGKMMGYERDVAGNVISKTDPDGRMTTYTLDQMNRLSSVTSPKGEITSYQYNQRGDLIEFTDPLGNKSSYQHDVMGRIVKKVGTDNSIYQMSYDTKGNLIAAIDPKGVTTAYEYDSKNNLISKSLGDDRIDYVYDEFDNLLSISNSNSEIQFSYTKIKGDYLVANSTLTGKGDLADYPEIFHSYTYDSNTKKRKALSSYHGVIDYNYNTEKMLTSVKGFNGRLFNYNYDSANRLVGVNSNGYSLMIERQNSGNANKLTYLKSSSILAELNYQYSDAGLISSVISSTSSISYGYDSNHQLVLAESMGQSETFSYDEVGNRVTDINGAFSYDSSKQRLVEDYRYVYVYDGNGNLVSKQEKGLNGKVQNFTYNSLDRLTKVDIYEDNIKIREVRFSYDPYGRRLQKTVIDYQENKEFSRKYEYDGQEILAIYNSENEVLARYTPSYLQVDDMLEMEITSAGVAENFAMSSGSYFFVKDALGTVKEIRNMNNGGIVQSYDYSAFGTLTKINNSLGNDITSSPFIESHLSFTGRELDNETGLYYYRARYYDSHSGRFLGKDRDPGVRSMPITFINSFIYSGNNPINYKDPSGNSFWKKLGWIALGSLMGPVGILLAINFSGEFSSGEIKLANTIAILSLAAISGAAAGAAVGAAGYSAWVGAAAGGLAGGVVGGVGFELFNLGTFQDGFIQGAIVGGIAGYYAALGAGQGLCRSPASLVWPAINFVRGISGTSWFAIGTGNLGGSSLNVGESGELDAMKAEEFRRRHGPPDWAPNERLSPGDTLSNPPASGVNGCSAY